MKSNPLGYFCAPNATDPHYAIEYDFERFVAFGLFACYQHLLGPGSDALNATNEDVKWLRHNFLNAVENAAVACRSMSAEKGDVVYFAGDHDCSGPRVPLKGEENEALDFQWIFERLDKGGEEPACLLFILTWSESDDFAIWLAVDTLEDTDNVRQVLEKARAC